MKKIKFLIWVIVACIMFIAFISFSIIYGDRINKQNIAENVEAKYIEELPVLELPENEKESEIFLLTAYCPCPKCSEGYGDMTATGKKAKEGRTIAVDPDVIPYGTEVYIDGKMYVAEDCGGFIKGKHIDIYFDSHSKANKFGKRYAEVEI